MGSRSASGSARPATCTQRQIDEVFYQIANQIWHERAPAGRKRCRPNGSRDQQHVRAPEDRGIDLQTLAVISCRTSYRTALPTGDAALVRILNLSLSHTKSAPIPTKRCETLNHNEITRSQRYSSASMSISPLMSGPSPSPPARPCLRPRTSLSPL